jgi:hypothetical protein
VKVYTDGKEEAAARQELQVPVKARRSWNELIRAMIWWSRLSRRFSQTFDPDEGEEVDPEASRAFLEGSSATTASLPTEKIQDQWTRIKKSDILTCSVRNGVCSYYTLGKESRPFWLSSTHSHSKLYTNNAKLHSEYYIRLHLQHDISYSNMIVSSMQHSHPGLARTWPWTRPRWPHGQFRGPRSTHF